MAYFLSVDESGHDRRESPYEVLAGVAVEDRDLWNLIQALRAAEGEPAREQLKPLVDRACNLRHRAIRERMGNPHFVIWSFALIHDLRAREELGGG